MKITKTQLTSLVSSFDWTLQDIQGGTSYEQMTSLPNNLRRIERRLEKVETALAAGVNKRASEDAHLIERAGRCRDRFESYIERRTATKEEAHPV